MSSKKVILTTLGILALNLPVGTAQAAGLTYSFTNTFDTAVIDGSYTEWNPLANNVHVPMYIAGNPTKPQLSDLYLRYDCQSQTISALVLKLPTYSVVGSPWIKIYELGNSPRVDESYNPPNGIQPEFSWVPPAGSVQPNTQGYEASFSLAPGYYTMEAHLNIDNGSGSQTSSTGRSDSFINLNLTCPTESLNVSKTADPFYLEKYDWTINKSVTPDSHTMFIGDSAKSSTYTVAVEQTVTPNGQEVEGKITITNSTSKTAIIANVIDTITPGNISVAVNCGVTFPYTLLAGQTLNCSYTQTLTSAFSGQNEVIVLPGNGSQLFGGYATANFAFDPNKKRTTGSPTVDVVDTKKGTLQTSLNGDQEFTYKTPFDCPTDPSLYKNGIYEELYDNTATIQSSGGGDILGSASASVKKTCYAPVVTKTAVPSITETLGWTLKKEVSPTALSMNAGESNPAHYIVAVDTEVINTTYAVSGVIKVTNPNPDQDMTVAVTDMLVGSINVTVDCGNGSSTLTVPKNSSATCAYNASLPDGTTRLNTATATLNNINFFGTATVDFSGVSPTIVGPLPSPATVKDTNTPEGSPWTTNGTGHQEWEYDETLTCSTDATKYSNGHYSFPHDNTATIEDTDQSSKTTITVDCYAPQVSKTAVPAIARTLEWTIEKRVTPSIVSMNIGDSQKVDYEVEVKTKPIDSLTKYTVTGNIEVTNSNPTQAMTVVIADSLPGSSDMVVTCDGGSLNPTISAGGHVNCTYSASLPDGSDRTNTATASLNGLVAEGTAPVNFSSVVPTDTGPTPSPITVTDTVPNEPEITLGETSTSQTWNYSKTLTCSKEDVGKYTGGHYSFPYLNTATIKDTDKSDTETVTVNCYVPIVSKTATTSFTRVYQWSIDKQAKNISLNDILLQSGQTYVFSYDITVNTTGYQDKEVTVHGDINVINNNPEDSMTISVADNLPGATSMTLDCGGTLTIGPNSSKLCQYTATLPDNSTGALTNTAQVMLNGVQFSGQAPVTFGAPALEKDKCVKVTDQITGDLPWTVPTSPTPPIDTTERTLSSSICTTDVPKTFSYPLTVGPYSVDTASDCKLPESPAGYINNTATVTTKDTNTSSTAEEHVPICVPKEGKCTLTQGYWKTHSYLGKAPESQGWMVFAPGVVGNSPIDPEKGLAGEYFFLSGKTYYEVLWTAPAGNAYYILARQWIAAYLNWINGASMPPTVSSAFNEAWKLFAKYTPAQVGKGGAIANQAKAYAATLDSYNNGLTGPGHCSDDSILFGGNN